jgi:hypothetical protein
MKGCPVDAMIRFPDAEDDADIRSLAAWLREDPDVSRDVSVELMAQSARPGDQGGAFDVIQLVFTDAVGLANVLVAYATWRATRRVKPKTVFERNGRTAEDTDGSPDSRNRVMDLLSGEGEA